VDPERQVIFQEGSQSLGWLVERLESLGLGYGLGSGVRNALFPGSSLVLGPLGSEAALARIDREALLDYYRRHYVAGNSLLIVVGNVTPEQALARAGDLLGDLPVAEAVSLPAIPPSPESGPHQVTVRGPLPRDEVAIMVGARTVGRDHPDYWPLIVLAEILDDQLTEEIRYEQGLVYGLSAYNRTYADAGYFVVYTDSAPGNRETILQAIEAQLAAVEQGEIEPEILADAQAALRGRWALAMEDNQARAGWLAVGDLARVAGTYFVPTRSYVGFHRPILTLSSGLIGLSAAVVLALSFWFWRRRRRRRLA
jgi:predicted Zn-dependent peptidase